MDQASCEVPAQMISPRNAFDRTEQVRIVCSLVSSRSVSEHPYHDRSLVHYTYICYKTAACLTVRSDLVQILSRRL